jgi:hypothetical protein
MNADERAQATDHLKRAIALTTIYFAHPDGVPADAPEHATLDAYLGTNADREKMIAGLAALARTLLGLVQQETGLDPREVLRRVAEANQITPE